MPDVRLGKDCTPSYIIRADLLQEHCARQRPPERNAGWAAAAGFPVIPTHKNWTNQYPEMDIELSIIYRVSTTGQYRPLAARRASGSNVKRISRDIPPGSAVLGR